MRGSRGLPALQQQEPHADLAMSQGPSYHLPGSWWLKERGGVRMGGWEPFFCLSVVARKEKAQARASVEAQARTLKGSQEGRTEPVLRFLDPD